MYEEIKMFGEIIMSIDTKMFLKLYKFIEKKEHLKKVLYCINKASSKFFAILYMVYILWLLIKLDQRLIKFLLIPALVLGTVSILRKVINRKRPFEVFKIKPIITHEIGGSFPSKHASSAMIIAIFTYWINPVVGSLTIGLALLTAISRVLAGIHYLTDVVAGIFIAFLFSMILLI